MLLFVIVLCNINSWLCSCLCVRECFCVCATSWLVGRTDRAGEPTRPLRPGLLGFWLGKADLLFSSETNNHRLLTGLCSGFSPREKTLAESSGVFGSLARLEFLRVFGVLGVLRVWNVLSFLGVFSWASGVLGRL